MHGANRLGCNALLELLVFGRRTGIEMDKYARSVDLRNIPADSDREVLNRIKSLMDNGGNEKTGEIQAQMQEFMMEKVSVFRTRDGLLEALEKIRELKERYKQIGLEDKGNCFNRDLLDAVELGHMLDLAEVIAMGALYRQESRGAHSREDFPQRDDEKWLVHTMARYVPDKKPELTYRPVTITRFQPQERKY